MLRSLPLVALFLALTAHPCGYALSAPPEPRTLNPEPSPLHARIDRLIESAAVGPLAPLCSDADFVRRICLDLTGVIPTAEQARAFVADTASDKRPRLIDNLLASPAFVRHMTVTFDSFLIERKAEKVVKQPQWEEHLYRSIASDKPLDQLFRELLVADLLVGQASGLPSDLSQGQTASQPAPDQPPAALKFVLDRDAEPNLLTRDIGRLVFGMDLQCCQCHDHPLIDDYYQSDYYGLFAFVHRAALFTDAKTKLVALTEKADGEAAFKSVFTGDSSDRAQPRLPKGPLLFAEPSFPKGDEYAVKPDKTVRGIPKFSRRAALAELLPASRAFHRNLANRLWSLFFDRGLVHPLDFHHAANPPVHPELLSLLADILVGQASGLPSDRSKGQTASQPAFNQPPPAPAFHLRRFLRELALTRAYQRSCDSPRSESLNFADIVARLDQLTRDKPAQQQLIAPREAALAAAITSFKSALADDTRLAAELSKLVADVASARQEVEKLAAQRRSAEQAADDAQKRVATVQQAAEKLTELSASLPDDKVLATAAANVAQRTTELTAAAQSARTALAEPSDTEQSAAALLSQAGSARRSHRRPPHNGQPSRTRKCQAPRRTRPCQRPLQPSGHRFPNRSRPVHPQLSRPRAVRPHQSRRRLVLPGRALDDQLPDCPLKTTHTRTTRHQHHASHRHARPPTRGCRIGHTSPTRKRIRTDTDALSAGGPSNREAAVQLELLNQLRGNFREFIRHYGGESGQEFQATASQALFFGNGTIVDAWLKPTGDNLASRLAKLDDSAQLTDELYYSVFSRPPASHEMQQITDYLQRSSDDKQAALAEILWALLSSTEFRFNH